MLTQLLTVLLLRHDITKAILRLIFQKEVCQTSLRRDGMKKLLQLATRLGDRDYGIG